jgi:hypothetical protein
MVLHLDTEEFKEAIKCYIRTKVVNADEYNITFNVIASRNGGRGTARAEVTLEPKHTNEVHTDRLDGELYKKQDKLEEVIDGPVDQNTHVSTSEDAENTQEHTEKPLSSIFNK